MCDAEYLAEGGEIEFWDAKELAMAVSKAAAAAREAGAAVRVWRELKHQLDRIVNSGLASHSTRRVLTRRVSRGWITPSMKPAPTTAIRPDAEAFAQDEACCKMRRRK